MSKQIKTLLMTRHLATISVAGMIGIFIAVFSILDTKFLIRQNCVIDTQFHEFLEPQALQKRKLPPHYSYIQGEEVNSLGEFTKVECLSNSEETFGYVDAKGNLVIPAQFVTAGEFHRGFAPVSLLMNGQTINGFIDKTGKVIHSDPHYTSTNVDPNGALLAYDTSNRCFLINPHDFKQTRLGNYGTAIDVLNYNNSSQQIAALTGRPQQTEENGLYEEIGRQIGHEEPVRGIVDRFGKEILKPKYDRIDAINSLAPTKQFVEPFGALAIDDSVLNVRAVKNRYFKVMLKNNYGLIDRTGKELIPCQFDDVLSYSQGVAAITRNRKVGFANSQGHIVISPKFDFASPYGELIAVYQDGEWSFIDKLGKPVKTAKVDYVPISQNGEWMTDGLGRVVVDGKVGFMDSTGAMVIAPQYLHAGKFNNGMAPVWDGTFSHYINTNNQAVGTTVFGGAGEFEDGLAMVGKPGPLYLLGEAEKIKKLNDLLKNMWLGQDLESARMSRTVINRNIH